MALFTEDQIRLKAQQALNLDKTIRKAYAVRGAFEVLNESTASFSEFKTYDIFLSHSIHDAELILGIKATFEELNYSVYVDWIDDPKLDRSKVTSATADTLRKRMNSSKSLFYVTTENADGSRWMPWECGYFDGKKGKSAIVPIKKYSTDNSFNGQEYLGLYPYIVKGKDTENKERLWVRKSNVVYISYDAWVSIPNTEIQWKNS